MTVAKPLTTAASLRSCKAVPMASHKCDVFYPCCACWCPVMQKTAMRCGQRNCHDAVRLRELGAASGIARP